MRWTRAAGLAAGLFTAVISQSAFAVSDVLDRPASAIVHVERSVLLAIARANGRLVTVGEHGTVLLSEDAGISFKQASVPASVTLTSVCFPTPAKGWAVGHSGIVLA